MEQRASLHLAPQQRFSMTFSLANALKLLEMPQLELSAYLEQALEENPLLEEKSTPPPSYPLPEIAQPPSFYAHLLEQIREAFPLLEEQKKALELFDLLDEKGFLPPSIPPDAEPLLRKLQTLDPPGIFARSLQESLLLQLKAKEKPHKIALYLIEEHFDDLLHQRYAKLEKHFPLQELSTALHEIGKLQMRPKALFEPSHFPHIKPDLLISHQNRQWTLQTAQSQALQITLSSQYESIIPQNEEEKKTLLTWKNSAKWLLRSLARRSQILLQVSCVLVRKQAPFLLGKGRLRPLTLQELSEITSLHPSTLSRALSGKYADTPRGILPLRALLTSNPMQEPIAIVLEKIIREERSPLSDTKLGEKLKAATGLVIARRTVTKYREKLLIPPAAKRKFLAKKSSSLLPTQKTN